MSKKKTTKATPVKLTPKQASVVSVSLIRGLDNAIEKSRRGTADLETLKSRVGTLSAGLSNLASTPVKAVPVKVAAKAKVLPAKVPSKAAKAKAAKTKPVPAKPVPAKPVPAKPAAPKSAKPKPTAPSAPKTEQEEHKAPVPGRPSARRASKEILSVNGGSMKSADLRKAVCAKYGQYSNQTFYEVFKNDPEISLVDNVVSLVPVTKPEPDLELVRKVESDRTTASVV